MIKIVDFKDYRDFLDAKFNERKTAETTFTYQFCAQRLKTTKSYLKLVTQKKRQISADKISAIARLFKLDDFEKQYLTFNFLYVSTKDPSLKEFFQMNLRSLHDNYGLLQNREVNETSAETEFGFQSWLSMTIHALARTVGFKADADWIQKKLNADEIPIEAIRDSLKDLLDRNLIVQQNGRYTAGEFIFRQAKSLEGSYEIYKVGLERCSKVTERAQEFRPFNFYMMAISLSKKDGDQLIEMSLDYRNRLMNLAKNSLEPEEVYFISNNFFNCTPSPKKA